MKSLEDRFMAKVCVLGDDDDDDCWLWQGATNPGKEYGRITVNRKTTYAHRVSYELFVGPIHPLLQIDHLCGNKRSRAWNERIKALKASNGRSE